MNSEGMRKSITVLTAIIVLCATVFMLGPRVPGHVPDATPITLGTGPDIIADSIAVRESGFATMKPGNAAGIVWADGPGQRTEYSVVFLHGFTASKVEGRPVTTAFAREFGMNLYEARLYGHGLDTADALMDLTPENYVRTAREAVAIGKVIGEKVILMSSSTGGTLSLYLAAHDPGIAALLCYSPNIRIYDPTARVLTLPWGLQIARLVTGSEFRSYKADDDFKRYWQTRTRLEAAQTVQSLIEATMTGETFGRITQPVFVGCYYKDADAQDKVVSVEAMRAMMPQLGTDARMKRLVEFPGAGNHVITSPYRSGDVEGVLEASRSFAMEVLGLAPVSQGSRIQSNLNESSSKPSFGSL